MAGGLYPRSRKTRNRAVLVVGFVLGIAIGALLVLACRKPVVLTAPARSLPASHHGDVGTELHILAPLRGAVSQPEAEPRVVRKLAGRKSSRGLDSVRGGDYFD